MIGETPMNDLFFVRYQAKLMLVDSIDMPPDVELAHRRLCDFIWAMDKCPEDNDSTLPEICRVKQADWVRVRGGLLMKGWSSRNGFFEHGGALKTLQEAKKEYETNQNRAKTAAVARWSKSDKSVPKQSSSNAQAVLNECQLQSQSQSVQGRGIANAIRAEKDKDYAAQELKRVEGEMGTIRNSATVNAMGQRMLTKAMADRLAILKGRQSALKKQIGFVA